MFLLILLGCVQPDSRDWIKEVLYQDNWRYLQRSPEALSHKFTAMASSPYTFMRGNLSIQLGHWSRLSQARLQTHFLNVPDATTVPIFGDAHPENLTVCAYLDQPISVEIVDLDAATYAPWILDVRRALTAQRVFASMMEGCEQACQDDVVTAWVDGFWDGIEGRDTDVYQSKMIVDLIDEALEEGLEKKKYHKYTTDETINRSTDFDAENKAIFSIDPNDTTALEIFAEFAQSHQGTTRLLDVAQRFGMGISSRAAIRYVFLWDQGADGEQDNQLLLAREVFDPPVYPGRLGLEREPFESNAHRVDVLRSQLWHNQDADPNYNGIADPFSFKTQTWSSYFQDIEVPKIQEDWEDGEYNQGDLVDLATVMGGLSANIAGQSKSLSGRPTHLVIAEDVALGGGFEVLLAEMQDMSRLDFEQQQTDYRWFQRTVEREGPLLGLDALGEW